MAAILQLLDAQSPDHCVDAIWDVLHPWRAGEAPSDTARALAPWLGYVQIKDGDAGPDGTLGQLVAGQLTLDRVAAELTGRADLWWSLEWEKQWHPELVDLPQALDGALGWYRHTVR